MTEIKKRNREIIKARKNGVTGAFLGRKYGMTRSAIWTICTGYKKPSKKHLSTAKHK